MSLIKHIVGQTFSLFHSTQTGKFVLQGGPWDKILLIELTSFIIKLALNYVYILKKSRYISTRVLSDLRQSNNLWNLSSTVVYL